MLRAKIFQELAPDIISISESHCANDSNSQPSVEGYTWIGHCRKSRHRNSVRNFGGVGIFINNRILKYFKTKTVTSSVDGILGVLFTHKTSDMQFLVFSCYLPPEESPWGRDSNTFYAQLLSYVYLYCHCDHIFICGDFNSRIGKAADYISDVDVIEKRTVIDEVKNNHGDSMIEFLIESKMATVNGRITPHFDNFTSVSGRGRAVVDYVITSHDSLSCFKDFKVLTAREVIEKYNLLGLLSENCKCPDHSLLLGTIDVSKDITSDKSSHTRSREQGHYNESLEKPNITNVRKQHRFKKVSDNFMSNNLFISSLDLIINEIQFAETSQNSLDCAYNNLCKVIFDEMDKFLGSPTESKKSRKLFKSYKPFWNENLTELWRDMHEAEKQYLRF